MKQLKELKHAFNSDWYWINWWLDGHDPKAKGFVEHVIGVDNNPLHQDQALRLGIVDEIMTLEEAIMHSDLIVIATPINIAEKLLSTILNLIDKQVVFDVGSTKESIVQIANVHSKRKIRSNPPNVGN